MESRFPARETLTASEFDNAAKNVITATNDQNFLLHFIMGTYFGPDLKEEPHIPVFQRGAEKLPPYTSDQLAGSHMRTLEIERIYYYILRKADPSVVIKHSTLHQFLLGNLSSREGSPGSFHLQFGALFPTRLHPHSRFNNQYDIISNIAFINEPGTHYIHPNVIKKFKEMTRLEELDLDRHSATTYTLAGGEVLHNVPLQVDSQATTQHQNIHTLQPVKSGFYIPSSYDRDLQFRVTFNPEVSSPTSRNMDPAEQGVLFLPTRPSEEEWSNIAAGTKNGVALTGSAAPLHVGPVLGLLDIGECDDSFLFHVSLPGVKRDEKEFSCEVERDGTVLIRGVTEGGESRVHRHNQVFEMQTQNLCPPGPFSMSFKLPGPVDPHQFSGNFGNDGILEGIVMKL